MHTALSCWFTRNHEELIVSAVCLGLTLARFHSRHDLITATGGGMLGMVWELPCTHFGVWRFPHPQLLGLIPLWLPLAYAVFFITLSRITFAIAVRVTGVNSQPFSGNTSRLRFKHSHSN
jgi:hypothetical protein